MCFFFFFPQSDPEHRSPFVSNWRSVPLDTDKAAQMFKANMKDEKRKDVTLS